MPTRTILGLACATSLLLFAAGGGYAQAGPAVSGVDVDPGIANAPWSFDILHGNPVDNFGRHASLVVDNEGRGYVSYYEAGGQDLWLARYVYSGGNCGPRDDWNCELVASFGDVGQYSSMDVFRPGGVGQPWRLAVAYYEATGGTLMVAEYRCLTTCSWTFHTVSDPTLGTAGRFASLEYDAAGQAHIAYHYRANLGETGALMYAYEVATGGNCGAGGVAGKWQCDTIDIGDEIGEYTSLDLDDAGYPSIAYYDAQNQHLKLASPGGDGQPANCGPGNNTWTCRLIDGEGSIADVGRYASMAVDGTGGGRGIAYFDQTNNALKYAEYVATGGNCGHNNYTTEWEWQCDYIENIGEDLVMGISLARYDSGHPIIAYHDAGEAVARLKVARPVAVLGGSTNGNCGPQIPFATWRCDRVGASGYTNGQYASLALNRAGLAYIAAYDDSAPGMLILAWQSMQVDLPVTLRNR